MLNNVKLLDEIEFFNLPEEGQPCYAIMQFETALRLGVEGAKPSTWINTKNLFTFNGAEALYAYAEIPNPASQLIKGENKDDLLQQMNEMITNYQDQDWLNENLYPYI